MEVKLHAIITSALREMNCQLHAPTGLTLEIEPWVSIRWLSDPAVMAPADSRILARHLAD